MRELYVFEKDGKIEKRFLNLNIPFEKGALGVWKIYGWKVKTIGIKKKK